VVVQRAVVRNGFTHDLAGMLLRDIKRHLDWFATQPGFNPTWGTDSFRTRPLSRRPTLIEAKIDYPASRHKATPPSRPVSLETMLTFLASTKSIFLVLPPPR
jgi:hypothetical protein